jgi:GTP-binding protein YchF
MQIGIVGLPYSGKSTLFQTITKTHLDASAIGKNETHQSVIKVPDERLDRLAEIFCPQKTTRATIDLVDVVGLKKGDSGSTQFTSNFLGTVKTNEVLVQVVRLFEDHAIPHPEGSIDMVRDFRSFETEFILSDLFILENRIEKITKQIQKSGGNDLLKRELPALKKSYDILHSEQPLREAELSSEDLFILKSYQLLTLKPMLIALNLDENQREDTERLVESARRVKAGKNTKVLSFHGKIEMEMSALSDEDAELFMSGYGIKESALHMLIREAYDLLGLQSFYTVGEDECRAWTIKKGMTAQEAAGVVHSDFFNKFIRAEVVGYDDFIQHGGSFPRVKENGVWRLEGKEYVVQEGDILSIRHS